MSRRAAAVLLLLLVTACGGRERPRYQPPSSEPLALMRAHIIDVGQGDATLLELPCGAALIDTGGESNGGFDGVAALRDYLDAFFARRTDLDRTIDLLVLTHAHVDHTRGLPMVLERYKVRGVVDNGRVRSSGEADAKALHVWLASNPDVRHREVGVETIGDTGLTDEIIDPFRCPEIDPEVTVLWGAVGADPGWRETPWGKAIDNENNHSVAVRFDFGRASFLFTGDLEETALETFVARYQGTPALDVDVYKVGHHGSRNGTTEALVRAMSPRVAVFSMGSAHRRWDWSAWQYGHPGGRVVELLEKTLRDRRRAVEVLVGQRSMEFSPVTLTAAAYGTGWEGTVVVEATTRGRIKVKTAAPVDAQTDD